MNWRILTCLGLAAALLAAQDTDRRPSPQTIREWQGRKYGMFIHFGLYSTLGGVWKGRQYSGNYSEQIQSDAHIPPAEYAALAGAFQPSQWDPDAIVELARQSGMRFIVLTSKHHDGFSLFHTRMSSYNAVDATPYKRDLVKSLADACARAHMPFGVYYSTIDWNYGDIPDPRNDNPISDAHADFNVAQIRELLTGYGPISEIWFDMGHPTVAQSRRFAQTVHSLQSECLINGRIWNEQGDFMEMGDHAIPEYILDEPWESPASIYPETWGYRSWLQRSDLRGKVEEHILRLVKVVSRGGNYILNIGPRGDGSVVEFEADVLKGTGTWLRQNGEAIYGADPQPFRKLDFGYATVKGSRLFLFVEHLPADGRLRLPGLRNHLRGASLLGGGALSVNDTDGDKSLTLSAADLTGRFLPVVAVDFDGPLDVSQPVVTGSNGVVELDGAQADRFYNTNGEGYYDARTLRKLQWHFVAGQAGRYRIEVRFKPGKFAKLLDVAVDGRTYRANLHGNDPKTGLLGTVDLSAGKASSLTVTPGSPAERGARIEVEIDGVRLVKED